MISLPTFQGTASSASDVPVLDLNFAGPNGFFATKGVTPTLTRGSVATYTDSAGVLRTTNSNIILQSNVFTASPWTTNGTTVALTTGTTSPDLSLNAFELKDTVTSAPHVLYQIPTGSVAGPYTLSLYVKKSGKRYIGVAYTGILQGTSIFDTELGIFTQTDAAHTVSVISASNGWYRFVITAQAASAGGAIGLTLFMTLTGTSAGIPSYIGDGTGIYIYGVQLEEASYAGPYSSTTTAATNNGPRIDYDPVTLACKGLLIEEGRTNLTPGSNDFANATNWLASNVTLTPASAVSPDGFLNAFELKDTTSNSIHQTATAVLTSVIASTNYTFSFYAKKAGKRYVSTNRAQAYYGNEDYVVYDLELGTITKKGVNGTATITLVGNGWYRCTHTLAATASGSTGPSGTISLATSGNFAGRAETYIGNGTGIYIYGAQFEVGSFPTSYIPTTTAAVARNTESCYLSGTAFSSWFNASEGTFVVNARIGNIATSFPTILVASDGGVLTNNLRVIQSANLATIGADAWTSSSQIANFESSYSIDSLFKVGLAYKVNNFAGCFNNGTVSMDVSGAVPTGINQLLIGSGYSTSSPTSAQIKTTFSRIRYYNKSLPNLNLKKTTV
jgi:hypothetical protein